jgi:hypothetical protein
VTQHNLEVDILHAIYVDAMEHMPDLAERLKPILYDGNMRYAAYMVQPEVASDAWKLLREYTRAMGYETGD